MDFGFNYDYKIKKNSLIFVIKIFKSFIKIIKNNFSKLTVFSIKLIIIKNYHTKWNIQKRLFLTLHELNSTLIRSYLSSGHYLEDKLTFQKGTS